MPPLKFMMEAIFFFNLHLLTYIQIKEEEEDMFKA